MKDRQIYTYKDARNFAAIVLTAAFAVCAAEAGLQKCGYTLLPEKNHLGLNLLNAVQYRQPAPL